MSTTKVQSDMVDIDGATTATIVAGDKINFLDITDSLVKEDTVQGILDLAGGGNQVLVSTVVASDDATINILFTPGDADLFIVEFEGVVPASDNQVLWVRTTTNASTFDSGGTDYQDAVAMIGGTGYNAVQDPVAQIRLSRDGCGNAAGESMSGWLRIHKPADAALYSHMSFFISSTNTSGENITLWGTGMRDSAADIDGVQFLFASGNVTSGRFSLYKITHA
jgi:hypothetical protein